jgi:hydroxyacylglutathione hydrolase
MLDVVEMVDEGLGNASYLVDIGDGRAVVIDPSRDPAPYLAVADERGLEIAYAAETHLHADFVSGSRELAERGATVLASATGNYRFDHAPMGDGEELELAGLVLRAVATPGHTPEHLSYLFLDGDRPLALFTGGALLVGSVARTDLISDEQTIPLAKAAYRSAHKLVDGLSADVGVYPTHGAGSFCSAPTSSGRTTTVGRERASNQVLLALDEDVFASSFLGGLGTFPAYFLRLRPVNQRGPAVFGDSPPQLASLQVERVQEEIASGAVIVDVRPFTEFADGHISGSVSIELRPQFASWLGWLVPEDRRLVFVMSGDQDRDDVVRQCLKIGYETLAGELEGGFEAWRAAGLPEGSTGLATVDALVGTVVDVRQEREAADGRIPGAINVELGRLAAADLPVGPLTLYCGHGQRGMTGASVLEQTGRTDVHVLDGGPDDWSAANGRELERVG